MRVVKHSPPRSKVPLGFLMPLNLLLQELDAARSLGQADPREMVREFASLGRGSTEDSGPSLIE